MPTFKSDASIETRAEKLISQMQVEYQKLEDKSESYSKDAERLSEFMTSIRWLITSMGGIVFALAIFIGWAGFSSLGDVKTEISETVPVLVAREIERQEQAGDALVELQTEFTKLQKDYESYQDFISGLQLVQDAGQHALKDPHFAYTRLKSIGGMAEKDQTEDRRRSAILMLDQLFLAGKEGRADPNILFNAAAIAARMNMDEEALRLTTLAAYWKPSKSHTAGLMDRRDVFGVSYTFDGTNFTQDDQTAEQVRAVAWETLLELVRNVPRESAEQVYSRASNVADRSRDQGLTTKLIETIETTHNMGAEPLTSYAYKTLADLYAWRGGKDWRTDYWHSVERAIDKMKGESRISTWNSKTVSELLHTARRLGLKDEVIALAEQQGLNLP